MNQNCGRQNQRCWQRKFGGLECAGQYGKYPETQLHEDPNVKGILSVEKDASWTLWSLEGTRSSFHSSNYEAVFPPKANASVQWMTLFEDVGYEKHDL